MSDQEYPVLVEVQRDGRAEQVRVGTAVKQGDSFVLRLGALTLGAPVAASPQRAAPSAGYAPGGGAGGVTFPNYGRRKGEAIAGAPIGDLEYYANGCRRTLDDPGKSRWHDKERVLLAAIEAEIARQRGGGGGGEFSDESTPVFPGTDDDVPF